VSWIFRKAASRTPRSSFYVHSLGTINLSLGWTPKALGDGRGGSTNTIDSAFDGVIALIE